MGKANGKGWGEEAEGISISFIAFDGSLLSCGSFCSLGNTCFSTICIDTLHVHSAFGALSIALAVSENRVPTSPAAG